MSDNHVIIFTVETKGTGMTPNKHTFVFRYSLGRAIDTILTHLSRKEENHETNN